MDKKIIQFFQYLLIIILSYSTWQIFSGKAIWLITNADLLFHEAGHMILIFAGDTLHYLGGTLGQMSFPIIFTAAFILRRQLYSALIMLWWLGENLTGIGIYMADARAQVLTLIGGDHDWAFLFAKYNLLPYDVLIGNIFWWSGIILMVAALGAGAFITYKYTKSNLN